MSLETFTDEATGITAEVDYDDHAGSFNPRTDYDNCWTILTNMDRRIDIDENLDPDSCMVECEACGGTGETHGPDNYAAGMAVRPPDCPDCDGYGERNDIDAYLRSEYDAHLIVPVYCYEHGLVSYSASVAGNPYSCEWDSGMVGVAVISKAKIEEEWPSGTNYHDHKTGESSIKSDEEMALLCLDGELETYTDWANGHVYTFRVEAPDGEYLDGCSGIYGYEYAVEEAEASMKYEVEQAHKEQREARYWLERGVETVGR